MTKIMLVEDDKSLREIYGVRLLAEGYDIVSAGDGEEALAMAIKERPALIVTDLMMPKISGFDMLDILRSTTETKNIKVIVMTALGSEEQRARGDMLGADRYLVKSQVGIEDVVRAVHEVLGDKPAGAQQPAAPAVNRTAAPGATLASQPGPQPNTQRTMATVPVPGPASAATAPPVQQPAPQPPVPSGGSVSRNRIIQPLSNATTPRVDINELLDRELAKEAGVNFDTQPPAPAAPPPPPPSPTTQPPAAPPVSTTPAPTAPPPQPPTAPPVPTIQIDTSGNVSMPNQQQPPNPPQPPSVPPRPVQ
jgi:CheY-like chemotaxis protein